MTRPPRFMRKRQAAVAAAEEAELPDQPAPREPVDLDRVFAAMRDDGFFLPGRVYDGLDDLVYHRGPGVSRSDLQLVDESPAAYRFAKQHPKPPTEAYTIGRALHCLLLEPARFADRFLASEHQDFSSRDARIWRWIQEQQGFTVLRAHSDDPIYKPSAWDQVHRMRDAVMAHPDARELVDGCIAERSCYWEEPVPGNETARILSKCRFDGIAIAARCGVDVKTTKDPGARAFAEACLQYGYHVQERWYMRGQAACRLGLEDFRFIAVTKGPRYSVGLYRMTERNRGFADAFLDRTLETLAECTALGYWPDQPLGVQDIELPARADRNFTPGGNS